VVSLSFLGLGFFLNGSLLSNNSVVASDSIGVKGEALFCLTNNTNCCAPPFSTVTKGNWIFPNQTVIPPYVQEVPYTQSRYSSSVLLHHDSTTSDYTNLRGVFTCKVPDSDGNYQNLYVYMGKWVTEAEQIKKKPYEVKLKKRRNVLFSKVMPNS